MNYGFRGLLGLTSWEEGQQENVEWTVASLFSVCTPKLTIHYSFNPTPPSIHLNY